MKKKQNKEIVTDRARAAQTGGPEHEPLSGSVRGRKKYVAVVILLLLLVLLGTALFAYYRTAVYYRTHFFPNTTINGIDCSGLEASAAAAMLDEHTGNYVMEVTGRDYSTGESGAVLGIISAGDIDLNFGDTREAVKGLLAGQDELKWIMAYLDRTYSHTVERGVHFDREKLADGVRSWEACKPSNMKKPQNAYIDEYSEELGVYEIVPETHGTEMDVEDVIQLIADAVARQEERLDLEEYSCYTEAAVKQDDRKLTNAVDTVNKWLGTKVTYDWNGTKVNLDYMTLHEWITMEDGTPVLDEEKVGEFVKEQASSYDTYGRKKKFVTTGGTELTLSSRNYGWRTDTKGESEQLVQLIYQGKNVEREPVYSATARQKGANDIGSSYVEADLTGQHLYLYQDGEIVVESDFVSGTMISTYDCVTPEGIFGLAYKTRDAVLKGATYRTPVSYWMPFFGNYGMHDAKWRGSFGGQIYVTNGSHGCINLPPDKAAQIYEYVSEGFPVICYYTNGIPYIGPGAEVSEEPAPEEEGGEEPQPPAQPPAETPQPPAETPPAETPQPPAGETPPSDGITVNPIEPSQPPAETPQPPAETPPAETPQPPTEETSPSEETPSGAPETEPSAEQPPAGQAA